MIYLPRTEGVSSSKVRAEKRKIRVGIVGSAILRDKFIKESQYVNGVEIVGISSAHKGSERAEGLFYTNVYEELLEKVEITERDYKKFPTQLSGGQQQRIAVVRGVINAPEVLFADEPTGALNSNNSTAVLDVFTKLHNDGQSIILVTHDKKTALRGNRVLYVKDGKIYGECDLGGYTNDSKDREAKLNNFLTEMGW